MRLIIEIFLVFGAFLQCKPVRIAIFRVLGIKSFLRIDIRESENEESLN
jgi:hypothetical protein